MIRKAELKDIPSIIRLIKEFFEESLNDYGLLLNDNSITETLENYIKNYIGIVVEENEKVIGVVGGLVSPSIFDKTQLIGQETIWYVDKRFRNKIIGLKLMKAFEEECKKRGAYLIAMVHMGNLYADILDKFYKHRNYKLLEIQYIKGV